MKAVVDASAVVPLLVDETLSNAAEDAVSDVIDSDGSLHCPELLYLEAGSALWRRVRQGYLEEQQALLLLERLNDWSISAVSDRSLAHRACDLSLQAGCTIYDACYLALADRLSASLISADRKLVEIASRLEIDTTHVTA